MYDWGTIALKAKKTQEVIKINLYQKCGIATLWCKRGKIVFWFFWKMGILRKRYRNTRVRIWNTHIVAAPKNKLCCPFNKENIPTGMIFCAPSCCYSGCSYWAISIHYHTHGFTMPVKFQCGQFVHPTRQPWILTGSIECNGHFSSLNIPDILTRSFWGKAI